MTPPPDLSCLTEAEKDALIVAQWRQIEELSVRIAALEAKLGGPTKGPGNSSVPPSQGHKANKPRGGGGQKRRRGHGRGGRKLSENPDQRVAAKPLRCPHCRAGLVGAAEKLHAVYDKIDLPPVMPIVTRVSLYGADCPCCGEHVVAPAPEGLEPGSPFGPRIQALAVYLRYGQIIPYQRLATLFGELWGLEISEGGLANLFQRASPSFDVQVQAILARLRRSPVVCSDETGARIKGRNAWEWVFQNDELSLHVIRNSRAKAVAEDVMAGHKPAIWVSDLYAAQRGHGERWQICLAHQLRDCQYALEAGDAVFAGPMKRLLLRACALGRRRHRLKDTTLKRYAADLERRLDKVMACQPSHPDGKRLRKRYGKDRGSLFTFMTERGVGPTNNGSERDLRPSATFRKVTGGFRSDWGPDFYAAVRSTLNTGRKQGLTAFQAIERTISGRTFFQADFRTG
jgi:transposase